MFFVVRSIDNFNFPLGLIKYIVIIVTLLLSLFLLSSFDTIKKVVSLSFSVVEFILLAHINQTCSHKKEKDLKFVFTNGYMFAHINRKGGGGSKSRFY